MSHKASTVVLPCRWLTILPSLSASFLLLLSAPEDSKFKYNRQSHVALSRGQDLEDMVSAQSLTSPVTWGKLRTLSGPQLPHLDNGDDNEPSEKMF